MCFDDEDARSPEVSGLPVVSRRLTESSQFTVEGFPRPLTDLLKHGSPRPDRPPDKVTKTLNYHRKRLLTAKGVDVFESR